MKAKAQTVSADAPALVLFGRDEGGKGHAAHFLASEVSLAQKAAGLMGMRMLPIATEAEVALASKTPRGKIFESGRAFTPFVKATILAELERACPAGDVAVTMSGGGGKKAAAAVAKPDDIVRDEAAVSPQPKDWDGIQVGAIVLATAAPLHQTWFECEVTAIEGGDLLTVRFADYPNEPSFTRHRGEVGLLHPLREIDPPLEAADAQSAAA